MRRDSWRRKMVAAKLSKREISSDEAVRTALAWMERRGSKKNRDGMARYGIVASRAFGITVADLRQCAKSLGRDRRA